MGCGASSRKPIQDDPTMYSPSFHKSPPDFSMPEIEPSPEPERKISYGKQAEDEEAIVLMPRRMVRQYSVELSDRYTVINLRRPQPTDQPGATSEPQSKPVDIEVPKSGIIEEPLEVSRTPSLETHSILPPIKRDPVQLKYEAIGFDFDFLRLEQVDENLASESETSRGVEELLKEIESV